jgi:hypothetical protein
MTGASIDQRQEVLNSMSAEQKNRTKTERKGMTGGSGELDDTKLSELGGKIFFDLVAHENLQHFDPVKLTQTGSHLDAKERVTKYFLTMQANSRDDPITFFPDELGRYEKLLTEYVMLRSEEGTALDTVPEGKRWLHWEEVKSGLLHQWLQNHSG